jgi:hypothetical protein
LNDDCRRNAEIFKLSGKTTIRILENHQRVAKFLRIIVSLCSKNKALGFRNIKILNKQSFSCGVVAAVCLAFTF